MGVHLVDPIEGAPLGADRRAGVRPGRRGGHARALGRPHAARAWPSAPARRRCTDMQIMAGFVGLGAGQGLATLLERVLGREARQGRALHRLEPPAAVAPPSSSTRAGDVAHLLELADELARRAAELGRTEWVAEEHERRYGPEARISCPTPRRPGARVKGGGRLSPATAPCSPRSPPGASARRARRDKPASWVVPDRTLVEIAHRRPADARGARGRARPARPHPRRRRRRRSSPRCARARTAAPLTPPAAPLARAAAPPRRAGAARGRAGQRPRRGRRPGAEPAGHPRRHRRVPARGALTGDDLDELPLGTRLAPRAGRARR